MKHKLKVFAILFFFISSSIYAQDCPMQYQSINYYGGHVAQCQGGRVDYVIPSSSGVGCASTHIYPGASGYVDPQLSNKIEFSGTFNIGEAGYCDRGIFIARPLIFSFKCVATLNFYRSTSVPSGRKCDPVSSFSVNGENTPILSSPTDLAFRSINAYKESPVINVAWTNSTGYTRIEYQIKVGATLLPWKSLGLFLAGVTSTNVDLENLLLKDSAINTFPYDLSPYGNSNVTVFFRLRTEAYDGSASADWIYPKGISPIYNNTVDSEYALSNEWDWGGASKTENYTNSGSFRVSWPVLVWGQAYMYSYLYHNGSEIELGWGKSDYVFRNLSLGTHVIEVVSCDMEIYENEAACMTNKTRLVVKVQ